MVVVIWIIGKWENNVNILRFQKTIKNLQSITFLNHVFSIQKMK